MVWVMSEPATVELEAVNQSQRRTARQLAARLDDGSDLANALRHVLEDVANGERVVILRPMQEVTPAQAAQVLGVTRQFVDRLCADGILAFRRLPGSSHRRIRLADVLDVANERGRRAQGRTIIGAVLDDQQL